MCAAVRLKIKEVFGGVAHGGQPPPLSDFGRLRAEQSRADAFETGAFIIATLNLEEGES